MSVIIDASRSDQASAQIPSGQLGAPPSRYIIDLNDVDKTFRYRKRSLSVFSKFTCKIESRSFVSIVGPSGCGKSTLLKLISGLETPSSGSIAFSGSPVIGPPKGMIYVFQQYTKSIFPWRTVVENVEFGLRIARSISSRSSRELCREYIDLVGLGGYEDYYPYQLSGGMQQRVCIARALICQPQVLLMDEPFSAVDAMTRAILQELIMGIWQKLPVTILFVTHDIDEAVLLSTRIISLGRTGGGISEDLTIDLPFPRDQITTRANPRFTELRQRLFSAIFMQEKSGSSLTSFGEDESQ